MEGHGITKTLPSILAAAVVLLLALLLLLLEAETCAAAAAAGGHRRHDHKENTTEFIRAHCGTTDYPRLCFNSLSAYASTIQTSPKQLADAALSVTLTSARSTSALVSRLSSSAAAGGGGGGGGMKPREAAAVKDCMETMGDSVDELRESLQAMGKMMKKNKKDIALQLDNIQTWVSAALTDEDTCMDEFAGKAMDGRVKAAVRGHISRVARLTSNALALINGLSSTTTTTTP